MSLDPHHLLIGLAFGLVALAGLCLYLQRRLVTGEAEQVLLEERLRQAISAQQGLTTQLDGYRVELAELSGIKSEQQAELAALRRETELLRTQRGHDTEIIADLQAERDAQQAELRRLSAAHAALEAAGLHRSLRRVQRANHIVQHAFGHVVLNHRHMLVSRSVIDGFYFPTPHYIQQTVFVTDRSQNGHKPRRQG